MSADNGVYILETKDKNGGKEYRVAYHMAVENYMWDHNLNRYTEDSDILIANAREMWDGAKVHQEKTDALAEAASIAESIGFLEYGIQFVKIERIF